MAEKVNIKDDINLHSIILDKLSKDIEMLRKRTHDISQNISVHSYMLENQAKVAEETIKAIKVNAEMIDKLNIELFQRRTVLEFISEKISSTKALVILFMAFILFETFSITPMVLKHLCGW